MEPRDMSTVLLGMHIMHRWTKLRLGGYRTIGTLASSDDVLVVVVALQQLRVEGKCTVEGNWRNSKLRDFDYVAPSIAGLDKLGGHEPIYQRRRGKEERGAVVIERRTRKYMRRGAEVLLPDNPALGSGIYLVIPRRGMGRRGMEKQKTRARCAGGGGGEGGNRPHGIQAGLRLGTFIS
jgi:hypothetical protein